MSEYSDNDDDALDDNVGTLQERIVKYMSKYEDLFSNGVSLVGLNRLVDKNQSLVNEIIETKDLKFSPRFPFQTHEAILNVLLDNQKFLSDALKHEVSRLPKNTF
jgi:hypothetical protein